MMKNRHLLVGLLVVAFAVLLTFPLLAEAGEQSGIETDEDALFGNSGISTEEGEDSDLDDDMFGDTNQSAEPLIEEIVSASIDTNLLTAARVEIGGRYSFSAQSSWVWNDPNSIVENITTPDADSASVVLGTTLFLDARPSDHLRVFGKTTISYPFDDVFHVDELFSDFTWNEMLFFRGGKHTINWGIGRLFSPADLLNVTEIDPENPEAEREGPVSLKIQWPWDAHNLYLYFIANSVEAWDEIGIAGKAELVFGSMELGIGALYLKNTAPSGMLTVSVPFWDIDFLGEAVVRYGSDRTFVEESESAPLGVLAVTYDDKLFYHATVGLSFIYPFDEVDSSISFMGQYLYNGEGYDDPGTLQGNTEEVEALFLAKEISLADLRKPGKHYAAANAGWNGIFGSDFTLQAFWIHNFSDMSGYVSPTLSVSLFDGMSLSLQTPYQYGEAGDEYSLTGDGISLQFSARLGGGSF